MLLIHGVINYIHPNLKLKQFVQNNNNKNICVCRGGGIVGEWMFVCVSVYMLICVCIYVYVCVGVHMRICMCIYVYVGVHMRICIYVCVSVHMRICIVNFLVLC